MSVYHAAEFRILLSKLNRSLFECLLILGYFFWSALLHDESLDEVFLNG